jgi:hypothetical protein
VRHLLAVVQARSHQRSDHDRGDPRIARARLVEDDEDDGALELQQRRKEASKPAVAGRHRAVVHIVAQVRDDERKVGQAARLKVSPELTQRHDAPQASRPREHAPEVEERHVLLRVAPSRGALPARPRQTLRIVLPRAAARLQRVGETLPGDRAARAVARDPVRRAGHEREVVRQARVPDAPVARQHGALSREGVEGRRPAVVDHLVALLVLEHDNDHVVEGGHTRRSGISGRASQHGRENEGGPDEPAHPVPVSYAIRIASTYSPPRR